MTERPWAWPRALGGAAALGAAVGLAEAGVVLAGGRLWIDAWAPLLLVGAGLGALVASPGAALSRLCPRGPMAGGVVGGALMIALFELAVAVVTDPPPFGEAPWWVGSPAALLGGGLALLATQQLLGRLRWAGAALAALSLLGLRGASLENPLRPRGAGGGANLLLVTLDTTRADRLSAYGGRASTPAMESLAADGLRFDAAFAPIAVTGPSHTSLMSGTGTWTHGVLLNGVPAPQEQPLLAELARAEGYRTAAFVSAYVLDRRVGLHRGFATYDDDFSALRGAGGLLAARLTATGLRRLHPDEVLERRGDDTVDLALSWLEQAPADEPWLLWVHLFDAHGPYTPPPPYDALYYEGDPRDPAHTSMAEVDEVAPYLRESLAGITDVEQVIAWYDGEISFADAQLGRLLAGIEARGEVGETLVVVAGDHGESLGEHGVWFDHGDDVYDPSLRVPLVLRMPGALPGGEVRGEVVELVDVLPTVTALLGLPTPPDLDGRSLLSPEAGGEARSMVFDREANVEERQAGKIARPTWRMVGLRSPSSLYVRREAEGYEDALYSAGEGELYRPMGEVDTMSEFSATPGAELALGVLRRRADALLEQGAEGVTRSGVELSEEERLRLEALGYIE